MAVDEIRMIKGDYVFVRDGQSSPLVYQGLQPVLLKNAESFLLGEITPEQHETVYLRCLEIEQVARSKVACGLNHESMSISRGIYESKTISC